MSSRHRPKRRPIPMPNVLQLVRQLQPQPGYNLACGYGVHDMVTDDAHPNYERCTRCGATYALPGAFSGNGSPTSLVDGA